MFETFIQQKPVQSLFCPIPMCSFEAHNQQGLSRHLTLHKNCNKCGKTFFGSNAARDFKHHIKTNCNLKVRTCQICNKDFKKPFLLRRHQTSCSVESFKKKQNNIGKAKTKKSKKDHSYHKKSGELSI